MPLSSLLAASLLLASISTAQAPGFSSAALSRLELQGFLQGFADRAYGKAFRHLGDERDFDHGHLLFRAGSRRPVAILYHTQELAHLERPGAEFGYLDFAGRNWIQWLDGGAVENARRYVRSDYPRGGEWDWFVAQKLPAYRARGTIVDRMLDPALGLTQGEQVEFRRVPCAPGLLRVRLPAQGEVCLALSAS